MKAVILAAAPARYVYADDWPLGSPPKCLFHVDGEALLMRQYRVLVENDVNDIRVVGGFRYNKVKKFIEGHSLKAEVVENVEWWTTLRSLRLGLEGVDDDAMLIYGDVYLTSQCLKKVLEDTSFYLTMFSKNRSNLIHKMARSRVQTFLTTMAQRRYRDYKGTYSSLVLFFQDVKAKELRDYSSYDVDWYKQTDEASR